jgi:glutamate-1-semialdehyde 2,1-aminomutase
LGVKIGGMPCAPSFVFHLGALSAAAKAVCIRGMLTRGFLFSSQLYVMWPHTESHVRALASALDETLEEVVRLQKNGALPREAGPIAASGGFARLV